MTKKILFLFLIFQSINILCTAQVNPVTNNPIFQSYAENNGDLEITDDSYLQDLNHFLKHPVDLNKADAAMLVRLQYLSRLQIDNFLAYRDHLGLLTDLHELQAVPSWDLKTIENILPYVFISLPNQSQPFSRVSKNSLLVRYGKTLQESKGYLIPDSSKASHYFGSPDKLFFRFKHLSSGHLQYGIAGSKDAGEEFFKGSQPGGFDFYSANVALKNAGIIKTLVVGDYSLNLGQGLIQWQTLGPKKGTEAINIERQSDIVKVYNSSGQSNFNRGAAITLRKYKFDITAFLSFKYLDANNKIDTLNGDEFVSSLKYSGYHRTQTEIKDRARLSLLSTGINLSYNKDQLHIAVNSLYDHFGTLIKKSPELYNKYAFAGNDLLNNSIDWSFTSHNLHSFGELAVDNGFSAAAIIGAIVAVSRKVDLSLCFRSISTSYHSFYSDAFTESGTPANETGLYAGIKINLNNKLSLSGYLDFFSFPWLKYRIDQPSAGSDVLLYADYSVTKNFKWRSKFRNHVKPANFNPEKLFISPVISIPNLNWSNKLSYSFLNTSLECSTTINWVQYGNTLTGFDQGSLGNFQLGWYPKTLPVTLEAAVESFNTGTYNSRIYSLQSDVLYNIAVPPSYGLGKRYLLNFSTQLNNATLYVKYSNSIFPGKKTIGSGLDAINGNQKTEIRCQLIWAF